MSRRGIIALLLLAVLLAALLLWRIRPELSPATPAAISVLHPPSSGPASPNSDLRPPNSEKPRPDLRRLLVRRDARAREAVLTFKDADSYRRFLDRAQKIGLTVLGQLDALRTVRIRYDTLATLEDDLLKNYADYANITANWYFRAPEIPAKADRAALHQIPLRNDTLAFLGATGDRSAWGRGITIAILDSGVAPDPTFGAGRVQYLNLGLGTLPGTGDDDGHGTAIAALAAGLAADAPGVAPAATLLSLRVTAADGLSDIFTLTQAILAATDAGAKILNLSLGGHQTAAVLDAAIAYATARGAIIVAAAGNDQAAQLAWPAADPRVISVGAVDAAGQQVIFSNSGPQLQIAAPGYGVQTAWLEGQRVYMDGTSASAPLVAGAIAAVMSQNPALTAAQAWAVVQQTASDAGVPGTDADYGRGILNLDWALNYANPAYRDPAVSAHYYDTAAAQLDVIVQNRSTLPASNLRLDVASAGVTTSYNVPTLAGGETYVVKVPVDPKNLAANGSLTFTSDLVTPIGSPDANPANNGRTSRVVAPVTP